LQPQLSIPIVVHKCPVPEYLFWRRPPRGTTVAQRRRFPYGKGAMRVPEILARAEPCLSFEFFPPRSEDGSHSLFSTIERLRRLDPGFVSVTYGAGGSTREKTVELVTLLKRRYGLETMAHLTCVGHDRNEIASVLDRLAANGTENVMALRGDPPRGHSSFARPVNGFGYASELVGFIRERGDPFALGGAGYPEGHVECADLDADMHHLRDKVAAGLDFLITQLFYDNRFYFRFVERARDAGISVPIVPGIMPVTNVEQIERFTRLCGATIPEPLRVRLNGIRHDPDAVSEVGVEHAVAQCRELLGGGVPGLHFYTLNQSLATVSIVEELRR